MGFEAKLGSRPLLKAFGVGIGVAVVGLTLRDRATTGRIIGAALGKDVDCAKCAEPENPAYRFDAIVVPGGGLIKMPDGEWLPSQYGQWRLEAAVLAYQQKKAPLIVLLDGKAGPQEDQLANLKYLRKMARKREVELPDSVIKAEDIYSENTQTNMDELGRAAEKYDLKKFLIATNRFHRTRATLFACRKGLSASSFSVEEALIEEDPSRKPEIDAVYSSNEVRRHRVKERVEVGLMLWESEGRLQTAARNAMLWARGHKTYEGKQPEINIVVLQEQAMHQPEAALTTV